MVEFNDLNAVGSLNIDADVVVNLTTAFQVITGWTRIGITSPGTLTAPSMVPTLATGLIAVGWPIPNGVLGINAVMDGGMHGPNGTDVRLQLERSFNGGPFLPLTYGALTLTGAGDVVDFVGIGITGVVASAVPAQFRLQARLLAGAVAVTIAAGTRLGISRLFAPNNAVIVPPP